MKFPILIHLLNNKANHIVMNWEDFPINSYFKIVRSGINPLESIEIEGDYRVLNEEEEEIDQSTQENIEPFEPSSEDGGTSSKSGEDSISASV